MRMCFSPGSFCDFVDSEDRGEQRRRDGRGDLQRTNSYPGKSAQLTNKVLWKSPKFFVMNYEAALTKGVDPTSVDYAEVGFSNLS